MATDPEQATIVFHISLLPKPNVNMKMIDTFWLILCSYDRLSYRSLQKKLGMKFMLSHEFKFVQH